MLEHTLAPHMREAQSYSLIHTIYAVGDKAIDHSHSAGCSLTLDRLEKRHKKPLDGKQSTPRANARLLVVDSSRIARSPAIDEVRDQGLTTQF